jgi:hypothetical protein
MHLPRLLIALPLAVVPLLSACAGADDDASSDLQDGSLKRTIVLDAKHEDVTLSLPCNEWTSCDAKIYVAIRNLSDFNPGAPSAGAANAVKDIVKLTVGNGSGTSISPLEDREAIISAYTNRGTNKLVPYQCNLVGDADDCTRQRTGMPLMQVSSTDADEVFELTFSPAEGFGPNGKIQIDVYTNWW